ncbi:hypothetical protein EXIGLDRAFT_777373 [Exidia glandulosa HHB12029]|uniref:Uncharacterized protein n=1 Tax=Exidia glandulosa HHB12029 TaxID=1314781 RepID=A0A165D1D7_EXIGL|nr:hypothetical protein EXIGLDRAFT_777373 [Exidia glandulosa HHB12029]
MVVKTSVPPGAAGRDSSPAPEPDVSAYSEDRHALAPDDEMVAFPLDAVKPYPDRVRYHVVWRTPEGRTYVALYAHAPVIPPPPGENGPIGCDCTDHWGSTRYGEIQSDLRPWCPDVYREGATAHYAPDLFDGYGPCIQREVPGLFTEWTDARTVETGYSVEFNAETVATLAEYREVAVDVLSYLGVEETPPTPPSAAATQEELWVLWATWVREEQKLRGFILERLVGRDAYKRIQRDKRDLWERLYDCGYFQHGPVGAWFARPDLYLAQIRFLLDRSVPVLYKWTTFLSQNKSAAFLKPLNDAPPSRAELPAGVSPTLKRVFPAARPPPPPCKEHSETHEFLGCNATAAASSKRKGSDLPPDNIDRTKRVVFQEPDANDKPTPPATPRRSVPTAPRTPIRPAPLAARFEEALYTSTPRRRDALREPESPASPTAHAGAPALLSRITSPTASTLSSGTSSRESSPVPAAEGSSLIARLEQPVPATALGTIEVIALSDDLNQPLAVETEKGRLVGVEIQLLPRPDGVAPAVSVSESVLEFQIGGDQRHPRLIIRANGRALQVIKAAEAHGDIKKWIDCFFVALQYGMTVFTGVEVLATDVSIRRAFDSHDVVLATRVDPDHLPPARWATWKEGAKRIVSRPKGFRAAMLRGGIVWRIARYLNNNRAVESHPTAELYELGSPAPLAIDDKVYHDDWLSIEEERAILGWSGKTQPINIWMWPPANVWDKYSNGIWTKAHENWFRVRVQDLQTQYLGSQAFKPFMTGHDWEQHLRGWKKAFEA